MEKSINRKGGENIMANEEKAMQLIAELAKQGFQYSDILKALKGAKDAGTIKSKGRGKVPEDSPLRNAVISAINSIHLNYKDGETTVDGDLLKVITDNTVDATSFMVTLNDNWKLNFVKNVAKEKKEKSEAKKDGPADFAEPVVA